MQKLRWGILGFLVVLNTSLAYIYFSPKISLPFSQIPINKSSYSVELTNQTSLSLTLDKNKLFELFPHNNLTIHKCQKITHIKDVNIIIRPTYHDLNVQFKGKNGVFAAYKKIIDGDKLTIELYGQNEKDLNFALIAAYYRIKEGKDNTQKATRLFRTRFINNPIIQLSKK